MTIAIPRYGVLESFAATFAGEVAKALIRRRLHNLGRASASEP